MPRLKFDNASGVEINGQFVKLTGKEDAVLRYLARHKGNQQTKFAILTDLYQGRDEPELNIVDVFVCKLRAKLRRATNQEIIKTVWGRGYVLDGTCEIEYNRQAMTIFIKEESRQRLEDLILASDKSQDEVIEIVLNRGMKLYEEALWDV